MVDHRSASDQFFLKGCLRKEIIFISYDDPNIWRFHQGSLSSGEVLESGSGIMALSGILGQVMSTIGRSVGSLLYRNMKIFQGT